MSRTVGRATSRIWFLLGALCVMVFGSRTASAQDVPKYGPPVVVRPAQPQDGDEAKAANALVDKYMGPVEAQPPTPEQQTQIAEAMKGLDAQDQAVRDAARKTLAGIGPAALGALREVAAKQDQPSPAASVVQQIEAAERARLANELKSKGQPGVQAAEKKCYEMLSVMGAAVNALAKAEAADDSKAIARARDAVATARPQAKLARQLLQAVLPPPNPGPIESKYGIRPNPNELIRVPADPASSARYGVRVRPPRQ